ncbi:MAG: DUF3467 domain-containing protein [Chloroflexota bacterium]
MSPQPTAPQPGRMAVHLPADLQPVYSNFVVITHSASEVVLDLAQVMPQVPEARVRTRVVMTPLNAKLLLKALGDNLARFEAQFGQITVPEGSSLAEQLFRPPTPDSGGDT